MHEKRILLEGGGAPLYRQIKEWVLRAIVEKRFLPGAPFPSEGELARRTGVSRLTVRQAANELVWEGLLIREKGKRPRVAAAKTPVDFLNLNGISHYTDRGDGAYVCRVLRAEYEAALPDVARVLGIRRGARVFALERLRSLDGAVFGWEKAWIRVSLCPGLHKHNFTRESLTGVYRDRYGIVPTYADGEIGVIIADAARMKLFNLTTRIPMVHISRTVYTQHRAALQVNHEIYRGDCYSFTFRVGHFGPSPVI